VDICGSRPATVAGALREEVTMSTLSDLAATPTVPPSPQRPARRPHHLRHGRTLIRAALHTQLLHRIIDRSICELSYFSPVTGRHRALPTRYAQAGEHVFILVSSPNDDSNWWRTFTTPYPVRVLLRRRRRQGLGNIVVYPHNDWKIGQQAYNERYPDLPINTADIFVVISLDRVRRSG
jgi:hypothetical protein